MNYNEEYFILKNVPNQQVRFIYHMSDIHIKDDPHCINEYVNVFENLYQTLRENKVQRDTSLIVITGDLVDSCDYNTDTKKLLIPFLKNLSKFCDIICIPGNHDVKVINNVIEERLDIVLQYFENVYYLPGTGRYVYNNITFSHSSIIDKQLLTADGDNIDIPNKIKIALFHGTVSSEYVGLNYDNMVDIQKFNGYDFCLFGDCHKLNFMNFKKTAAYCSSLLRTNRGENEEQHGIIKWDIMKRKGEFIEIRNDYGHICYTFRDYDIVQHPTFNYIPQFPTVILKYNNINPHICREEVKKLVPNCKRIIYKQYVPEIKNEAGEIIMKDVITNDLYEVEYQNELIKQYYNYYVEKRNDDQISRILQLNTEMNNLLDDDYKEEISTREINKWDILVLKFSNFFSYGEGNMINFINKTDSHSLTGNNHTGKTSLLNVMLYSIYGKCPKAEQNDHLINNERDNAVSIVSVKVNDTDIYRIHRSLSKIYDGRQDDYRIDSKLALFKLDKNGIFKNISGNNMRETNKHIRELFGDYNKVIKTNFMFSVADGIVHMKNVERFNYFTDITNISIFEMLSRKTKKKIKKLESEFKDLNKTLNQINISDMEKELIDNENREKSYNNIIEEYSKKIQTYYENIDSLYRELSKIKIHDNEYFKQLENRRQNYIIKFENIEKSIHENNIKREINNGEIEQLQNAIETMCLNNQVSEHDKEKRIIKLCTRINLNTKTRSETLKLIIKSMIGEESHKNYEYVTKYDSLTQIITNDIDELKNIKGVILDNQKIEEHKQIMLYMKSENNYINNQINSLFFDLKMCEKKIKKIDKKKNKYNTYAIEKYKRELEDKLINNKKNLYMIHDNLGKTNLSLDRVVLNIKTIKDKIKLYNEYTDNMNDIKEKIKLHTLYMSLISKNGLQSLLLNNMMEEIERHANNFLNEVTDFQIKTSKNKTHYENIETPKIDFVRKKRDMLLKSCQYSSYEVMIINIAIRVALMDTNSYTLPNLFILDEVFNHMDKAHLNKMDDILKLINSKVKVLLIASHLTEINSRFVNKISIIESKNSNVPFALIEGYTEEQMKEIVDLINLEENEPRATKYYKKEVFIEKIHDNNQSFNDKKVLSNTKQELENNTEEKMSSISTKHHSFCEISMSSEIINKNTSDVSSLRKTDNHKNNNVNTAKLVKDNRKPKKKNIFVNTYQLEKKTIV